MKAYKSVYVIESNVKPEPGLQEIDDIQSDAPSVDVDIVEQSISPGLTAFEEPLRRHLMNTSLFQKNTLSPIRPYQGMYIYGPDTRQMTFSFWLQANEFGTSSDPRSSYPRKISATESTARRLVYQCHSIPCSYMAKLQYQKTKGAWHVVTYRPHSADCEAQRVRPNKKMCSYLCARNAPHFKNVPVQSIILWAERVGLTVHHAKGHTSLSQTPKDGLNSEQTQTETQDEAIVSLPPKVREDGDDSRPKIATRGKRAAADTSSQPHYAFSKSASPLVAATTTTTMTTTNTVSPMAISHDHRPPRRIRARINTVLTHVGTSQETYTHDHEGSNGMSNADGNADDDECGGREKHSIVEVEVKGDKSSSVDGSLTLVKEHTEKDNCDCSESPVSTKRHLFSPKASASMGDALEMIVSPSTTLEPFEIGTSFATLSDLVEAASASSFLDKHATLVPTDNDDILSPM